MGFRHLKIVENELDVYVIDRGEFKIRKISNGQIETFAGNGINGSGVLGEAPKKAPLAVHGAGVYWDYFSIDALGRLWYPRTGNRLSYIDLRNQTWVDVSGAGDIDYYDQAQETDAKLIKFGPNTYQGLILGNDGENVLFAKNSWANKHVHSLMKLYQSKTETIISIAGEKGDSTGVCKSGVKPEKCNLFPVYGGYNHAKAKRGNNGWFSF